MKFHPTLIHGAFLIEPEGINLRSDGWSVRAFNSREFREHGLSTRVAQVIFFHDRRPGTLRGLHYQVAPATDAKLVRCIRGAIHAVIVDLRPESPSFMEHLDVELTAENRRALYIPPACAYGYQTLRANTEVFYQTAEEPSPACERGLRYDDPALKLTWPLPVQIISSRDSSWALLGQPGSSLRRETSFADRPTQPAGSRSFLSPPSTLSRIYHDPRRYRSFQTPR